VKLLTELEWERVFEIRCQAKRGAMMSEADRRLIEQAHREDPRRYADMSTRIFEATHPMPPEARP